MNPKYEQLHLTGKQVEQKEYLRLTQDEYIIIEYKNRRKTPWKQFGNRLTDFIIVTNKKLINAYLVKAFFHKNSEYFVDLIPFEIIKKVQQEKTSNGHDALKITLLRNKKDKSTLTIELRKETQSAIAILESKLS